MNYRGVSPGILVGTATGLSLADYFEYSLGIRQVMPLGVHPRISPGVDLGVSQVTSPGT